MSLPLLLDEVAYVPRGLVTFTDGVPLPVVDLGAVQAQMVETFATRADRDLLLTAARQGQVSFIKDYDEVSIYRNGAWAAVKPDRKFAFSASTPASGGDAYVSLQLRPSRFYLTYAAMSIGGANSTLTRQLVVLSAGSPDAYWRGQLEFRAGGGQQRFSGNVPTGAGPNAQGVPWPEATESTNEGNQFSFGFSGICWSGVLGTGIYFTSRYAGGSFGIADAFAWAEEIT